jgi:serine/threonine-protein kinase
LTEPTPPNELKGERYELQGVLGSGGQGIVHRAFDHWTGRPVAIKMLSSAAAREPQMAERLSREQQALTALKGTAAVEVLDIFRAPTGELCMVMELLKGINLDEHLQAIEANGERIELARVAEIFDPIVDTLEVAHKAGILHRDLKPANVFLLEDGGARLLDFGMARMKKAAPLTAIGTVMGSPSFIAPEAWKGQSTDIDHRADVYSLGVILFRVVAGDLPFPGISLYEKMLGSTKAARPSIVAKRPDLPKDADEWVALALAIDREQRFSNVRALWNAFLATFHVQPPNRSKLSSLWAKATGVVKELAGIPSSSSGDVPKSSAPSQVAAEPSFITQALGRSMMHVPEPESPPASAHSAGPASSSNERTFERVEKTLEIPRAPTSRRSKPTSKPWEKPLEKLAETNEKKSSEEPVETTFELSSANLLPFENTLPDATRLDAAAQPEKPPSSKSRKKAATKTANSKRRKKGRRDKSSPSRRRRR